jgi:hypothetical protein
MKRELDIDALYGALESKKAEGGISWRILANELELPDHTVFTRMSRGQVPDATTLLSLAGWLGVPLETYARGEVTAPDTRQQTVESIRTFLRADKALSPESADAITSVLRAAYDQLARRAGDVRAEGEAVELRPAPAS